MHALISIVVLDIHMTDIDINDRTDKYNISNDKYNILKQQLKYVNDIDNYNIKRYGNNLLVRNIL